jgi:hypothetical protein
MWKTLSHEHKLELFMGDSTLPGQSWLQRPALAAAPNACHALTTNACASCQYSTDTTFNLRESHYSTTNASAEMHQHGRTATAAAGQKADKHAHTVRSSREAQLIIRRCALGTAPLAIAGGVKSISIGIKERRQQTRSSVLNSDPLQIASCAYCIIDSLAPARG